MILWESRNKISLKHIQHAGGCNNVRIYAETRKRSELGKNCITVKKMYIYTVPFAVQSCSPTQVPECRLSPHNFLKTAY
jgi:hypothetical protein